MSSVSIDDIQIDLYTVNDVRSDLKRAKEYFQSLPIHDKAMKAFLIDTRHMPESVIKDSDAFFIDEETEYSSLPDFIKNESLGICRYNDIVMFGRCIFPVKTPNKEIMGLIGWDPTTKPKYLDSYTYGYKAKDTMFYGMEDIEEYYRSKKPVFVTEGPMCRMWLKANGFFALSSLGSHLSKYQQVILRRFGSRCIMIPDFDEAGEKYAIQVKYTLPKARMFMVKYGKDIDGCRKYGRDKDTNELPAGGIDYEQLLLDDLNHVDDPFYCNYKVLIQRQ